MMKYTTNGTTKRYQANCFFIHANLETTILQLHHQFLQVLMYMRIQEETQK